MAAETDDPMKALEPFVGTWTMEPIVPGAPPIDVRAHVTFD